METQQGQVVTPAPAAQQGQVIPQPAADVPTPAQTPAAPPADNQGQAQGIQTQVDPVQQQHFQSLYNKTLAEKFALEEQLRKQTEFQQQLLLQQKPQTQQTNPYDPNANWAQWIQWENREAARIAAETARQGFKEELNHYAQQANEFNWIQGHQVDMARLGITPDNIRAFNRMNNIPEGNFEVGWKLMTMPMVNTQVAQQAINQTVQQFQQPISGAQPLRGTQSVGAGSVQMKFSDLEKAFVESNGHAYDTWSPEVQKAFDNETYMRQQAERAKLVR